MSKNVVGVLILILGLVGCAVPEPINDYHQTTISHHEPDFSKIKDSYVRLVTNVEVTICLENHLGQKDCSITLPAATGRSSGVIVSSDESKSIILSAAHGCDLLSDSDFSQEEMIFRLEMASKGFRAEFLYSMKTDVYTNDGEIYSQNSILAKKSDVDLCLIQSDGMTGMPYLPVSDVKPEYGEKVYMVGAPSDSWFVGAVPVVEGRFTGWPEGHPIGYPNANGLIRNIPLSSLAQFTISSSEGASGSAIVNSRGEIVGIYILMYTSKADIGYGTNSEAIKGFLRDHFHLL